MLRFMLIGIFATIGCAGTDTDKILGVCTPEKSVLACGDRTAFALADAAEACATSGALEVMVAEEAPTGGISGAAECKATGSCMAVCLDVGSCTTASMQDGVLTCSNSPVAQDSLTGRILLPAFNDTVPQGSLEVRGSVARMLSRDEGLLALFVATDGPLYFWQTHVVLDPVRSTDLEFRHSVRVQGEQQGQRLTIELWQVPDSMVPTFNTNLSNWLRDGEAVRSDDGSFGSFPGWDESMLVAVEATRIASQSVRLQ